MHTHQYECSNNLGIGFPAEDRVRSVLVVGRKASERGGPSYLTDRNILTVTIDPDVSNRDNPGKVVAATGNLDFEGTLGVKPYRETQ